MISSFFSKLRQLTFITIGSVITVRQLKQLNDASGNWQRGAARRGVAYL
jgi:hypothetical protein